MLPDRAGRKKLRLRLRVGKEEMRIQETTDEDNDLWAALCTDTLQECGNEQGQAVYVKAGH